MIKRSNLFHFIEGDVIGDELMRKASQKDFFLNGIQVKGKEDITKIAVGVTCTASFLAEAIEWGAECCIFHHGLDLRTHHNLMPAFLQKQLSLVFKHDLTVAFYHYSLDAHPIIGNNVLIARKLNSQVVDELFLTWGVVAELDGKQTLAYLKQACEEVFRHPVIAIGDEKRLVSRLGIVSGGATPNQETIYEMLQKGVEVFISGEGKEDAPHKLLDSGIAYLLGGHYATEVFGVQALADKIQENFVGEVEIKFIPGLTEL